MPSDRWLDTWAGPYFPTGVTVPAPNTLPPAPVSGGGDGSPELGDRPPTVNATVYPLSSTAPLTVSFAAYGSDPDGDTLTYAWDFGDGATATGANTTHTYSAPGVYTAGVTVDDGRGGTATAAAVATVAERLATGDPASWRAPLTRWPALTRHLVDDDLARLMRAAPRPGRASADPVRLPRSGTARGAGAAG